jgi:glycine/D-amino acid oxidase-like deaminating enzyme
MNTAMEGRTMSTCRSEPVIVIGAGPYGLSTASHLRAKGRAVRVFGKPMDFWQNQMPKGMLLRSPWDGSHIGDPAGAFSLDRYEASLGKTLERRLPLEDFVRYGNWFQSEGQSFI